MVAEGVRKASEGAEMASRAGRPAAVGGGACLVAQLSRL